MNETAHKPDDHKWLFVDTWKRLILPEDRRDFEGELVKVCNTYFQSGIRKGRQDALDEIEKTRNSSTLPLEDPARRIGKRESS